MKSYTEISDQVAGGELIILIVRDPAGQFFCLRARFYLPKK